MNKLLCQVIQLSCFLFYSSPLISQKAIQTNILVPIRFLNEALGGGIEIAVQSKISSKFVVSLGVYANKTLFSTIQTGGLYFGSEEKSKNYIEKLGVRMVLKVYSHREKEDILQKGFFYGFFVCFLPFHGHCS